MTTIDRLEEWRRGGIISEAQYGTLSALVRKEWFSVFFELNALLYIGVVSLVAGLGWTRFSAVGSSGGLGGLAARLLVPFLVNAFREPHRKHQGQILERSTQA